MTCTEADIVATTLLAWDDELSKELVQLVKEKDEAILGRAKIEAQESTTWLSFWEQKHAMRLKANSADMKIRQIVNYKILNWDAKAQAYEKLAKEMVESWENAWATIDLMRKIDETPVGDYDNIARFFVKEWENSAEAIKRIKDNIANAWTNLYEQEKVAKKLSVNKAIKEKKSKKEIKKLIEWSSNSDKELIEKWLTPHNFSKPDDEWTVIKNTVSDPDEQFKRWGQYCLGKAILWWIDNNVLEWIEAIYKTTDTVWKLTADQIDSCEFLEELVARAYTNTRDLVEDWLLRDLFQKKLTELLSNTAITKDELDYASHLIRVSRFAEQWAWFSKIVMYDALQRQAEKMWIKVSNAKKLYDDIFKTIKQEDFIKKIDDNGMVTMDSWDKMSASNLLELLVVASWDERIPKLIREWSYSDTSILGIVVQKELWNSEDATKKIVQLINKVKELPSLDDSKDLALMTLCWTKIDKGAKKCYFNYRSMYDSSDVLEETRLKAEFEEQMANANRAEVSVDWLENLTWTSDLAKNLKENYAWGYIITNDSWWRNNKDLVAAIDSANAQLDADKQITVLYPRQSLMSNFTMEGDKLIFRSRDADAFNQMMDKVSLRTLWDASTVPELTTAMESIRDWKVYDRAKAIEEYNTVLEEKANKYFAAMLWKNEWSNPWYRDVLHSKLEDLTWIKIKSLRDLVGVDKNKLWQAVDTEFTNAQKTTWIFKSEITDITETIARIEALDVDWMKTELKSILNNMVTDSAITNENLDLLKQALEDYEVSPTIEDWMMNKGRLLSMANGWEAESFTLDQLVDIFSNKNYWAYKDMFFPNQEVTKEVYDKYVSWINNMIFDWLTVSLSNNLVRQWYALPLESVREVVLEYLTWTLKTSSNFAKSFLYKNWLPDSVSVLESIIKSAMPSDLKLWYEKALYTLRDEKPSWLVTRITTQENPFLPDIYSSLASIVNAKTWVIWVNNESKYLSNLLDKYEKVIKGKLKDWIKFEEAQQLKTQLWYALDIFEQDIVMAKYWAYLTPQQKTSISNIKSYIPIVVGKEWDWAIWSQMTKLENINKDIMRAFDKWIEEVVNKYSTLKTTLAKWNEEAIKKMEDQMKSNGTVMANVDWEVVIIDVRKNIRESLRTLPDSIKWFAGVDNLWWNSLDALDNPSAYFLNQLIESSKKLDALAKWEPAMMYYIDPELWMTRFFETFKLVDFSIWEKMPAALIGNILSWNKELAKFNLAWLDEKLKIEIFKKIRWEFQLNHTLNTKWLTNIIKSTIDDNAKMLSDAVNTTRESKLNEYKQLVFNQYQQAFTPYTHLRDIPSWVIDLDKEWKHKLISPKEKINEILSNEVAKIRWALEWLPTEYAWALDNVSITTPTGESITLRQFLDWTSPNWKKAIFDDESIMIKTMDEVDAAVPKDNSAKEIERVDRLNKEYKKRITNQYNEVLQGIQNQQQIVSEAERNLSSRMLNNARSIAKKYTLTNRIVNAANMTWGLEEEAARMVKYWLIWFKTNLTFGRFWTKQVMERLADTKKAYEKFYTMSLDSLNNIKPKNEAEELAQHLCRYFKTIENYLGSADGSTGTTTVPRINRAFYNIWEVFMNIDSIKWVFALMSAIEENQFLKFFKFSSPWQASYVSEFTRPASLATEDIIWWYREYVSKMPDNIDKDRFNQIFAANFTETEFKSLYQALSWLTYVGWYGKTLNRFLNFVNGTSFIWRLLVSYPWQLFTIPQQGIAYFLKLKEHERRLWESDLWEIDRIRSKYWTLDKAYNEINAFSYANPDDMNLESYYNRYWIPDINDIYRWAALTTADDVNDMYAKIANYQSTWDNMGKLMRSVDAYKDNANNIIDWLFARNFKNIAFLKAIRENAFMQFGSAQAFEEFMMNNAIDKQVKKQLMDAVNASAWRNFRNILWLGFWWLDRAVGWSWLSNIAYWLMQMFNFRWAWWQNIFKQTWETFLSAIQMLPAWWSKQARDEAALYIARTPEFTNLVHTLANDMMWAWKLQRYQDNGRWSELEDEYNIMDFLEYSAELLNMTSQWFQGIQSFWPARPVQEGLVSAWDSYRNPEVYKDTYWVWAFFNALGKNAWRNWKPRNWIFQAIQALEEWWPEWFNSYFQNQFWKLSFWSLRYMMDEDTSNYWYTYDLINEEWWIPSIFRWESAIGSDKSFSYTLSNANTWNALTQFFNDENLWEDRKTYLWDWWWAIWNSSNLVNTWKNALKILPEDWRNLFWVWNRIQPFTMDTFVDTIKWTQAWEELIRTWRVTPKTPLEMKAFIESYVDAWDWSKTRSNLKPFGSKFAKSIMNFEQFWHVAWEEPHSEDAELEMMLSEIRYEKDSSGKQTKTETQFWKDLVNYIHSHPTDMEATSRLVSQDVFNWLEEHNDNPNYLLYQSLVWQWMVDWYIDDAWSNFQDDWNEMHWGKKADKKINKTEGIESWWFYWDFMSYMLNSKVVWSDKPLVEYLQELDRQTAMESAIKIIKSQMTDEYDKKALERYVTFSTDKYWNEYANINSQYLSQLKALGWVWDAIDKWDVNLLVARMSRYANTYINTKNDPTGLNTATTICSLVNRVRQSDLDPELKQDMMAALAEHNIEFMQKNLDALRKVLWPEIADKLVAAWNELIYRIDWAVNSAIWEALMNWWDTSKWKATSSKLKNMMSKYTSPNSPYWASWNWYGGRSWDTAERIPYTLDIAKLLDATGGKWYTPSLWQVKIHTFKPTIDLSIGKDVKRGKKVYNTQEVKKKKVVL